MFADGVIESSATTGTGTYTLSGAAFSGLTFAQGFPSGGPAAYFAQTLDKSKWEFGTGTLTIGPPRTLTRATILKSSNAGSAIDWQSTDTKYIFSIASADALALLMAGNLGTSRPWSVMRGGRWLDYTAGIDVSWIDKLYSGSADVRTGLFDAEKALYFPDSRSPSTAIGGTDKTFTAAHIGGSFTFNTTVNPRAATLPAGATVKDGYHLEIKGLSTANGIVLTPDAGDGIDGGADGATKTIPGGALFTVRWSAADDQWLTDYTAVNQSITAPTVQVLTSGSAATYTTPAGVKRLRIRMVGGGGGGGGVGTSTGPDGDDGGDTSFDDVVAAGGEGGTGNATGTYILGGGGPGGAGGSGTAALRKPGGAGGNGYGVATGKGGGGASGAGDPGAPPSTGATSAPSAGIDAAGNSGGGGGAASSSGSTAPGTGGGGGEYVELLIADPAATYTYTVGASGAGGVGTGSGAATGGAGGSGVIIVEEFYNY
jgi:hypothetical protein